MAKSDKNPSSLQSPQRNKRIHPSPGGAQQRDRNIKQRSAASTVIVIDDDNEDDDTTVDTPSVKPSRKPSPTKRNARNDGGRSKKLSNPKKSPPTQQKISDYFKKQEANANLISGDGKNEHDANDDDSSDRKPAPVDRKRNSSASNEREDPANLPAAKRKCAARYSSVAKDEGSHSSVSEDSSYRIDGDEKECDEMLEDVMPEKVGYLTKSKWYEDESSEDDDDEVLDKTAFEDFEDDDDDDDGQATVEMCVPDGVGILPSESKDSDDDDKEDIAAVPCQQQRNTLLVPGPGFHIRPDAFVRPNVGVSQGNTTSTSPAAAAQENQATVTTRASASLLAEQGSNEQESSRRRYPLRMHVSRKSAKGGSSPRFGSVPVHHSKTPDSDNPHEDDDDDASSESEDHNNHPIGLPMEAAVEMESLSSSSDEASEARLSHQAPEARMRHQAEEARLRHQALEAQLIQHALESHLSQLAPGARLIYQARDARLNHRGPDARLDGLASHSDNSTSFGSSEDDLSSGHTFRPNEGYRFFNPPLQPQQQSVGNQVLPLNNRELTDPSRKQTWWDTLLNRCNERNARGQVQRPQPYPRRTLAGTPKEALWDKETIDLVTHAGLHLAPKMPLVPSFVERIRARRLAQGS